MSVPERESQYSDDYPDKQVGQYSLLDEMPGKMALDEPEFDVVLDQESNIYTATRGGADLGYVAFQEVGDHRVIIRATAVLPEHRGAGVGMALNRQVLDALRAEHKTITVICPVTRRFIERNPAYIDLVDQKYPGRFGLARNITER